MVSGKKDRVEKLDGALSPKQAMLMWLQDAHKFDTVNEYVDHLKDQPDSAWPMYQLPDQVASAVKQELKGTSWEQIDDAVRNVVREVLFLFLLQQVVNRKVGEESRYFLASVRILLNDLHALRREQAILKLAPLGLLREGVMEELLPRGGE